MEMVKLRITRPAASLCRLFVCLFWGVLFLDAFRKGKIEILKKMSKVSELINCKAKQMNK